jgi:L-lactate permease
METFIKVIVFILMTLLNFYCLNIFHQAGMVASFLGVIVVILVDMFIWSVTCDLCDEL